jgi:hypothetical protein
MPEPIDPWGQDNPSSDGEMIRLMIQDSTMTDGIASAPSELR